MSSERARRVWGRILCFPGRHKLSVIGRAGYATEHVGCERCERQWGMNHDVRAFLPWDDEIAEFHIEVGGYDAAANLAEWRAGRRLRPMRSQPSERTIHEC